MPCAGAVGLYPILVLLIEVMSHSVAAQTPLALTVAMAEDDECLARVHPVSAVDVDDGSTSGGCALSALQLQRVRRQEKVQISSSVVAAGKDGARDDIADVKRSPAVLFDLRSMAEGSRWHQSSTHCQNAAKRTVALDQCYVPISRGSKKVICRHDCHSAWCSAAAACRGKQFGAIAERVFKLAKAQHCPCRYR
mmetsp:Transcript_148501/g.386113  ORF Transcript_148501/g.386113 Transcript_148501/m.386113 type:complete len:194 (-) Transcript_148501:20-601(-)